MLFEVLAGEKGQVNKFELGDVAARHVVIRIAVLMLYKQCELRLLGCQIVLVHRR